MRWTDVRFALRALAKSPAFFLLAAAGTGLGAAAITTVLSVAGATVIGALPYREAHRLAAVWDQLPKLDLPRFPLSIANYLTYRAQSDVFEDVAAFEPRALTITLGDRAERVAGMRASANLLPLLGGSTVIGRWFEPSQNHAGRTAVAVLSRAFWRSRFGGDHDVIGKQIRVDDAPHVVIGVLDGRFRFRLSGEEPGIWVPAGLDPGVDRTAGALRAVARLRRGVTPEAAQARMRTVAEDLKRRYRTGMGPHGEDAGYTVWVTPLGEELFGSMRPTMYALAAASAILLALGLANTALLWLGRAAGRRREAAVRLALGASRGRVGGQLVMEALLPSLAGGFLALALTLAALDALNAAPPEEMVAAGPVTAEYRVFGFALGLSAAAGVLFGVLPMRSLFQPGAEGPALRQDRGGIGERGQRRRQALLVGIQVGLSCALLAPSLMLVNSMAALERVNPGFRDRGLLTATVSLPAARYRDRGQVVGYYRRLEDELARRFQAGNAAIVSRLPLGYPEGGDPFSIEGRAYGTTGALPQFAHQLPVGRDYLALMRIPLLSGRGFEDRDFAGDDQVALVNSTLAKAFWPRESPLGKRILMGAPRPGAQWMTIVGTVADVRTSALNRAPIPQIYRPYPQAHSRTMALVVDGAAPADLEPVLGTIDPGVPAHGIETIEEHIARTLARPRFWTALFSAYGLLASAVAAFGVYSLAVYAAIRRSREFALRAALGATGARLLGALLGETLRPAAMGAALGLGGAYAIARALAALLYNASAGNATAYLTAAALGLAIAALACGIGGRRALAADPAEVLRAE